MLGKLIKYEFKYSAGIFPVLYIVLLASAGLCRLFYALKEDFTFAYVPASLSTFVYILAVVAVAAFAIVISIMRFYKNLLGDEGYLSFTLPVKPWQHVFAKALTYSIWQIVSYIAIALSLVVVFSYEDVFENISEIWNELWRGIDAYGAHGSVAVLIALVLAAVIVSAISSVVIPYASMSIGQLVRGHRIVGAVAAYFGISFVTQILGGIFSAALTANIDSFAGGMHSELLFANIAVGGSIAVSLIIIVAGFFASSAILSKKLNLE